MSYFKMNLSLKKHGFAVDELDGMLPYEREVYVLMIENELKEKQKKRQQSQQFDIP